MCCLYSRTPLCLKIPLSNRVWDTGEYLDPSFIATGEYFIALNTGEYLVPNNKWEREEVKNALFSNLLLSLRKSSSLPLGTCLGWIVGW